MSGSEPSRVVWRATSLHFTSSRLLRHSCESEGCGRVGGRHRDARHANRCLTSSAYCLARLGLPGAARPSARRRQKNERGATLVATLGKSGSAMPTAGLRHARMMPLCAPTSRDLRLRGTLGGWGRRGSWAARGIQGAAADSGQTAPSGHTVASDAGHNHHAGACAADSVCICVDSVCICVVS